MPEQYNSLQEFSEYHTLQTVLYAKYAPAFKRPKRVDSRKDSGNQPLQTREEIVSGKGESIPSYECFAPLPSSSFPSSSSSTSSLQVPESDFLHFLKTSTFVSPELALMECEKRKPPLYIEMIFILGKLGKSTRNHDHTLG